MNMRFRRLRTTRLGLLALLLGLIWAKTLFAYYVDFSLGAAGLLQHLILILNPVGISAALLSLALYVRKPRRFVVTAGLIYVLLLALLVANVLYYREFTDFMTVNTVLGVSKVAQGLGGSTLNMLIARDWVYFFDVAIVLVVYAGAGAWNLVQLLRRQPLHWPTFGFKLDQRPVAPRLPQAVTLVAIATFATTMAISELNRPQLLTRTFDRNYIVKYLGLAPFTVYDGLKTAQTSQVRASAEASDMADVLTYTQSHYAAPDPAYYGVAKGKNVIIIHLESFQQFLIGAKIQGQEVTPFLNSLVAQDDTLSFDNLFNQIGLGKTSDAESMLETSTYGIPTGSLFTTLGGDNTFQGAPALLQQYAGYSSAVFHGGSGSFWNRNNAYKSLGYQYFLDGNYYNQEDNAKTEYGIKDKLMFAETAKYMEHLQQPFYSKIITTSNHYPFFISTTDTDFPDAGTADPYVNGYFRTAHYLDAALKEFFDYLQASGLAQNSLVMLYGDHYGISNDRNQALAPVIGKDPATWSAFDNTQMQRVPVIFHMPGLAGGVKHTYGGEIDVLPTLEHLLGIDTRSFVQFGSDLLSPQHDSVVAFINHNYITPTHTIVGDTVYANKTGEVVTPDAALKAKLKATQTAVDTRLTMSDTLANKNLLRYYVPAGFTPVNPADYNYDTSLARMLQAERTAGAKSTSLYSRNGNQTTSVLYRSDAPELTENSQVITDYPETVIEQTTPATAASESASESRAESKP